MFENSAVYFTVEKDKFNLPDPARLPVTENTEWDVSNTSVPYVFVADDRPQLTT